jgi:hypothetical protein
LRVSNAPQLVDGPWQRVAVAGNPLSVQGRMTGSGGVTAIGSRACGAKTPAQAAYVMASGFDSGWRAADGAALVAPQPANGWMMAWPARLASSPKIYVPAIAQLIGTIAGWTAIVALYLAARRWDALSIDERCAVRQP